MKHLHIIKLTILLILILLTSACSKKKELAYVDRRTPVKVHLAEANTVNIQNQFYTSGLVASNHQIEVSAKVMGYLEKLSLEVGDQVKKGTLLARIKNQEVHTKIGQIAGQIEEAQITLQATEKDYSRIKRLYNQQSATPKELDDITAQMKATKARIKQLESAKSEVRIIRDYSEIRSPIFGTVTAKYKNQGEIAHPGQPLLKIEDNRNKVIKIALPENYIQKIAKGTPVKYKLELEEIWKTGTITEISTAAEHGQYPAKISLPPNSPYLSGRFLEVSVDLENQTSTSDFIDDISIPKSALVYRGQLTGLFIPSDQNTALLRWVIIGKNLGDQIEILSGLSKGEKYILEAESRLMNGMPIEIIVNPVSLINN